MHLKAAPQDGFSCGAAFFCFLSGRCRLAGFAAAWSSRQMKHLENGVAGFDLLALHNGAAQTHFLGSQVVLKHGLAVQAKPRIVRAGNGNLNFRVFLHVLVNVLGIAGAEPQLAIQLVGRLLERNNCAVAGFGGTAALPACPVETTLTLIGDQWKVLILRELMPGTKRFGELKKSVGKVPQKVLTALLRAMEEGGLVHRRVYAEVPPRVECSLTELGRSLKPILDSMLAWGEEYKKQYGAQNG